MKKQGSLELDEIFEITEVGEYDTYDFVIPKTHCFLANGILVHNSGDIRNHADNVIFLYAPDPSTSEYEVEAFLAKGKDQERWSTWLHFNGHHQEFTEGKKPEKQSNANEGFDG